MPAKPKPRYRRVLLKLSGESVSGEGKLGIAPDKLRGIAKELQDVHGLGIEIHEDPRITRRRPDVNTQDEAVAPGMIFTIEPGAYLPGWGGVRIEDDVLVTGTGVEVLTDVTTELIEL